MNAQIAIPSVQKRAAGRRRLQRTWRTNLTFLLFVGPLVAGLVMFTYIPIAWGFWLSIHQARATITPQEFVGLAHYAWMLKDPAFIKSLTTFGLFTLFIVPTTYCVSLGLALLVNNVRFAQGFFRSVFFLPTACSYVIASLIWKMSLFNSMPYGFVNMVLYWLGLDPVVWLNIVGPPWYWVVLVTVRLWLQSGFYMLIFLAGLQEIPRALYEAAFVDGAKPGSWATFRHITWPLLYNVSVYIVLLNVIAAFQAFDEFWNILRGAGTTSLVNVARTPLIYLYGVAFGDLNYGRGSAGAFILAAIIIGVTIAQNRVMGLGKSHY